MTAAPAEGRWGEAQRAHERELFVQLDSLDPSDPRRQQIRDELVVMHLPLVRHLAWRYRERGESFDDLVQVGTVGLIKAVDRYDLAKGTEFSTLATPTILGEIKRHFRDRAWSVHVPRRMQELHIAVGAATDELTQRLGRAPTVRELAESLRVSDEDVLDALEVRHAYATTSLDDDSDEDVRPLALGSAMAVDDDALAAVDDRESLRPLLEALPERERRIVLLRFFENKSQSQIADELGISQMHVSRLLARTLADLRTGLTG